MAQTLTEAKGKTLTRFGALLDIKRWCFLFFFREPDFLFRRRLLRTLRGAKEKR